MTEDLKQQEMFMPDGTIRLPDSELLRFYSEVGRDLVELARMLRSPTEVRPFVYELRLDFWPASAARGLSVVKGFGEQGSVVAFQDGAGLIGQLRGLHDRMRTGKLKFAEDQYEPNTYKKRFEQYSKEMDYLAAKLPSR